MGMIVGEVTRNKALAIALSKAKVVDKSGKAVDLSDFTAVDDEEVAEVLNEAEDIVEEAEVAEAAVEEAVTEEAPAEEKPKKAAAKKKAEKKDDE
jgi:trigger factor